MNKSIIGFTINFLFRLFTSELSQRGNMIVEKNKKQDYDNGRVEHQKGRFPHFF